MKVLISDDERHVIQAIRLLVPWKDLGINQIFTASSGIEALAVIEHEKPEIVITDIIMEDMSGMDIMNYIAANHPSTKVIAVSGHNNFEYVRTMLTKGCMDYLLKPLETKTLVSTVRNAVNSWNADSESNQRHRHLQEKMNSLSEFYSGALLYKMMDSCEWNHTYQKLLQADARFASIKKCKILYYDTNYFPVNHAAFTNLLNNFQEKIRQLLQDGGGIILSAERNDGNLPILFNQNCSRETTVFLYESVEILTISIHKLALSLFHNQPFPFHMGSSKEMKFPEQFSDAYSQAGHAFLSVCAETCPSSIIVSASSASEKPALLLSASTLRQLEDQVFSAILIGHKSELTVAVTKWLSSILPEKDISLFQVKYVTESFRQLLSKWLSRLREQKPDFSYYAPDNLMTYQEMTNEDYLFSRSYFQQAILSVLFNVCDAMKENNSASDTMFQIAQYMELNYREPFVQSEYAERFYLNKDYMSRKFTTVFGINMLTYLNQIRIRHAKELLGDFSLKIQDIAFSVGFKDEKYFAKQFKKSTNTTPGDYRNTLKEEKAAL